MADGTGQQRSRHRYGMVWYGILYLFCCLITGNAEVERGSLLVCHDTLPAEDHALRHGGTNSTTLRHFLPPIITTLSQLHRLFLSLCHSGFIGSCSQSVSSRGELPSHQSPMISINALERSIKRDEIHVQHRGRLSNNR